MATRSREPIAARAWPGIKSPPAETAAEPVAASELGAVARAGHRRRSIPKVARVVDGKATTTVTFDKPGSYVLRAYAEDASIHTPHDVSVTVVAGSTTPRRSSSPPPCWRWPR